MKDTATDGLFALLRAALHGKMEDTALFAQGDEAWWREIYGRSSAQGVLAVAWDGLQMLPGELGSVPCTRDAVWPSIGLVAGYVAGILLIPKYISQAAALRACCWIGVAGTLLIVSMPAAVSVWAVSLIALACSLIWPAIWPLAMTDLGRFTKAGGSLLVASIVGGAVIPLAFGFLKDAVGNQQAYWICLPCYLFILYYACCGYKIRR